MSEENVEVARRFAAAYKRGDAEAAFGFLDPNVVWINYRSHIENRPFVGHEGIIEWLEAFSAELRGFRLDLIELTDAGGDQVLAAIAARGVGRVSEVPLELDLMALMTLLNGKIVRVQGFETRAQAFEAAGLSE